MESPEKENGDILNDSIDQLEAIVDTNQSPYVFYSTASNTNSNNLKDNSSKLQIYRQQACETPSQTPRFNKFNSSEIHPQNSHPTSLHRLPSNYDSIESFCCRDQQKQISSQAESGRGSSSRIGGLTSPSAVSAQSPVPVFGVAINGYQGQDNKQNNFSVLSQNIDIQQKDVIITSMVNGENEYTKNHKKQQQNNEIFKNNNNTNENIHGDQLLHYDGNNILTEKNFTFYNGSQKSVKKQRILIKKDIKNKSDDNRDYDSKDQHNGDKGNNNNNNNTNIEGVVVDASGVTKNSSGIKIVSNIDEKDNKHQVNYYSKGKCRSISSYYYCYSDKNTSEQQQQQLQQCMIGQDLIDDTKNKKNKGKKQSQKEISGTDQLTQLNNSNLIQERKQLSSQIVDDQQFRRKKIFSYHSGVNQIAKTEPDEGNNNNILMNGNVLGCLSQNQTFQNSTYQNYIAQLRQNFASSEKDQVNDEQQLLGLLPKQDQQIKQNNFLSSAKVISYQLNRIRQQVSLQQQVSAAKAMREESNGQQVGSITAGNGTTPLKDKNSNIEHNNKIKSNSNTNNNNISNGSYSQMNPSVKFLRKAFSQQGQATLNHNHNSFITKITPTKDGLGQIAMIKGDNNNNSNTNNSIPWRRSRSAERGNSSSKIRSDSESGEHYNPKRKRIMLGAQNYQMFESRGLMILPQSTQSEQSWQLFNDKLDQTEGKLQSGSNHISGTTNSNVKKPQSSSYPTRNHKQHGNVLLNSQIDSKINENNNQIDDLFFNGNSSNNNVIGGDGIKQQQQQQQQQSLIENVRIQSAKIDGNNQVVQKNKGDQYLLGNSQVSKVQQQQPQQIQQLAQIEINSKNSNTSQNNNINTQLDYSSNYQQGSSKKQEKKMQLAAWHVRKINKSNSNSNSNNTTNISQHKRHLFGQSSGQNNQSGLIDEFITEDVENQLIQSSPNQEKIIKINNKIKGQKDQNNNSNQFIRCSSLNQDNNSNINNTNSNNLRASLDIKRNINNSNFLNLDGFSLRANSQIPKGINEQQQLQQQQIMKQPKSMQFDLSPISPLAITFLQPKGGENNSNNNNKNHIFFPNLPARRADSAGRVTKPAYIINNNNINISNNSSNYNSNHIARTFSRQTNTTNNNNNNNNNSPTFVQLAQQVFRKI